MFRPHGRYKAIEEDFLSRNDFSVCPVCGDSEHIWQGMGTGEDSGLVTSVICTHCGWVCGKATFLDAIICKLTALRTR